jgi:hypothetical protein
MRNRAGGRGRANLRCAPVIAVSSQKSARRTNRLSLCVGWSRALVSCEGVRVARGACARYLCVLTSPYCPLLRSRGVTASTLLCYREYDMPDGTSARFLPLTAAALERVVATEDHMLPAGAATGRSCALPSTSSAFVARAQRVAHEQLPLSDHRGHSSGRRSNEQSHRCCSSCKSWLSL